MEVPKARGAGRSGPRRRTGCLTCRARKVRCDEAKPGCSNCDRLQLRCVYRSPTGAGGSSRRAISSPTGNTARPTSAAPASRSPDITFFNTVLRSDNGNIRAPILRQLPGDHSSEFDMLGFMGGITSELEQKHLDLTTSLGTLTASPTVQSLPVGTMPTDESLFDRRTPISPDAPSSRNDGSIGSSDLATTRGSWSDAGSTSYEDHLQQHFMEMDPPPGIFASVKMEWKYVRPAILAHARDFTPLQNALYCYADVHKAIMEGNPWRWAPTYYRASGAEIQACLRGEVAESTLVKIFGAVFLLMISELLSSSAICAGTSYLHSAYLILQRFHTRTQHWTGFGHLLVSWVSLLDVKSLIAGREGDPLIELGNIPENESVFKPRGTQVHTPHTTADDCKDEDDIDDPFRSPSYLIYDAIVGPAFRFFVHAQQIVRRIVCIDLHHRSRGTLSDEFEVLQIAHKVGADLETLWHRRPSVIDVYSHPEALSDTLCGPVALEVCRTFRQYVAAFLANFIYLHRVAFAIYPRTDRVNGAVGQIIQLATIESASPDHLPISFLWPIFVAGLEGTDEQRRWIISEMQRMAAAHETDSASQLARHPSADRVLVLLEEMTRRQDASHTWADSKCVRRELFPDFFVVI